MDFGLKRIGVAKIIEGIIIPLAPIMRKNRKQAAKELHEILIKECKDISEITLVVGLPYCDDRVGKKETQEVMQKRVNHFLSLIDFCGQIHYIDESYSSHEAEERLQNRHYKKRQNARKNGTLDSISACIILERYIAQKQDSQSITKQNRQEELQEKEGACKQEVAHKQETYNKITTHCNAKEGMLCDRDSKAHSIVKDSLAIESQNTHTKEIQKNAQKNTHDNTQERIQENPHIPVLLPQVLATFDRIFLPASENSLFKPTKQQKVLIDCTLGFGNMSSAILSRYSDVCVVGIDRDYEALEYNRCAMQKFGARFTMRHGDFGSVLPQVLEDIAKKNMALCGILADIGVSSYQLDKHERGFSFHAHALDMRMDTTQSLRADTILNTYSSYALEQIFRDYGEIREYKKLARLIVEARHHGTITKEVLHNIALHIKTKSTLHPATLLYQALRIAVNDELGQLQALLAACSPLHEVLLCMISFHSLEDRIIKETFKQWMKNCICDSASMQCVCGNSHAKGFNLYKKPLCANEAELAHNKRARSAKLRAFYFV